MVLQVCRQFLRDSNDVDDAFQATFLVLVRKASSLKERDLLGNWLYGVAHRVALRARSLAARRAARAAAAFEFARCMPDSGRFGRVEADISPLSLEDPPAEPWLQEEIARLPEKYRSAIVLCYMEGLTHEDAARRLQWPLGTVKGRLARARDLLKKRLTRRGFTMSDATLAPALCGLHAKTAVPAPLARVTVNAAMSISSSAGLSLAASSSISPPVAALGEGVLQTMMIAQIKSLALPLLLVGTVSTGVVAIAAQKGSTEKRNPRTQTAAKPVVRKEAPQLKPAGGTGSPSTTELLRDQLNADQELYQSLVVPGRSFGADDFRSLIRWSHRLLDADRSIASDPSARKAAYAAHRDRMKTLSVLAANVQPATKEMVQAKLKEAEELLESVPEEGGQPALADSTPQGQPAGSAVPGQPRGGSGAAGDVAITGIPPNPSSNPQGLPGAAGGMMRMMGRMGSGGGGMSGMAGMMGGMSAEANSRMTGRMGSAGSGMAGMMGGMSGEAIARAQRSHLAGEIMALRNGNHRSQDIWKKLDEPVAMSFANPTPFEDVLKYIKQATTTPTYSGIQIYVDPKALAFEGNTLNSPIAMDLEGIPLKTTLRLALKQLGLAYCVRDGVLIISSVDGIREELAEERSELEAAEQSEGQKVQ
jgi:RNA polymerase sigma factor (sigma-70 family)